MDRLTDELLNEIKKITQLESGSAGNEFWIVGGVSPFKHSPADACDTCLSTHIYMYYLSYD